MLSNTYNVLFQQFLRQSSLKKQKKEYVIIFFKFLLKKGFLIFFKKSRDVRYEIVNL